MTASEPTPVHRFIAAYNAGDWDAVRELMHPDYAHHNGNVTLTREQFLRGAAWLRKGLPDFALEVVEVIGTGDRLACRMVATGTHQGSLFGETATGGAVSVPVAWFVRLEDGVPAEDWEYMDEALLRGQLGA